MKMTLTIAAAGLFLSFAAAAQEPCFEDALLDHLAGNWVMTGTIAGAESTHDIAVEWVLGHQYLRIREVSREKTDGGGPLYEAIVFLGWDQPSGRYACLWLDSTGGGGLSPQAIGYAEPDEDDLAFVFDAGNGEIFLTTFRYIMKDDSWEWLMDTESGGKRAPFARVSLTRQ
ncbi:MAG: DUF1579 family protein [Candidatus Krumholzibacteriota bacterium]|nr:DUF1579 family protein [Candidatus Krumholzibacteriota bacterium]